MAEYRARNKERVAQCARNANLKRKYGLTIEDYDRMFEAQGFVCAICGDDEPGHASQKYFCVDHDHSTGNVRALLCFHCNTALGHAFDSPERLRAMADYLEAHGKQ